VIATEGSIFGDANVQQSHVNSVHADPRSAAPKKVSDVFFHSCTEHRFNRATEVGVKK
jgi:hypothetical protein